MFLDSGARRAACVAACLLSHAMCVQISSNRFKRERDGFCDWFSSLNYTSVSGKMSCGALCMQNPQCIGYCFQENIRSCRTYAKKTEFPDASPADVNSLHGHEIVCSEDEVPRGAKEECEAMGASLMMPLNAKQALDFKDLSPHNVWIGMESASLNSANRDWRISHTGGPVPYIKFVTPEPNNFYGSESCARIAKKNHAGLPVFWWEDNTWQDILCDTTSYASAVCCQKPPAGVCPNSPHGTGEKAGEVCYTTVY